MTLLHILKHLPYRGAGVLFFRRAQGRGLEVLLGRRRDAGRFWDIPAGGMSSVDCGSLVDTASRELKEEFGQTAAVTAALEAWRARDEAEPGRWSFGLQLPGYRWLTLLVELNCDTPGFPLTAARDYHYEFSDHKWFELSKGVRSLPKPTHPLVYPVVWKLLRASHGAKRNTVSFEAPPKEQECTKS